MANQTHKDVIVLYPSPGIGHLISMVELGKLILKNHPNKFSITILLTTGLLETPSLPLYIRQVTASISAISFTRFPTQHVNNIPTGSAAALFEFIRLNLPNARAALRALSGRVRALVLDLFCASALDVGREMGIPTYYFFTSGATVLSAFLHFPSVNERVSESFKDMKGVVIDFPGMGGVKAVEMPEPMLEKDDPAYWDLVDFCSKLARGDGIVVNSFDALEPIPIGGVLGLDGVCVPGVSAPRVFCVGPIIVEDNHQSGLDESSTSYLQWLDSQPSRSVVFLCFGSRGSFPAPQVSAIAEGLERSGHRFLWVVKKPPSPGKEKTMQTDDVRTDHEWALGMFPDGFLERTKERGVVVKSWAPQVTVLANEAVGGFVTHCGWNSVLEAVVAGVPMVAWPLYAEQHMNRNVMVRDMKIAIEVEQREEDGFVSSEEVEKRIRELMESENGREIRRESFRMRDLAKAAWGHSGSSASALDEFVASIIV